MNYYPKVLILSAESPENTHEGNRQRTETLRHCLEDCNMNFSQGTGFFRGEGPEASFVVLPRNEAEIDVLKDFAFKSFKQQAVLFQDNNQEAYLINHDGTEERLGRLQEVTKEVAENAGSYTLLNGKYYTTVKRPA